jgi:FMN-dependent NADH-azoreductase
VKLLDIHSSPGGESSDSITLSKSFIEACKSDNTSIVVPDEARRIVPFAVETLIIAAGSCELCCVWSKPLLMMVAFFGAFSLITP